MNPSNRPHQLCSDAFLKRAMDDWGGSVYRLALAHTGLRADAEDVYQEVFIKLAQDVTTFNGNEHLKAWLLRVTIHRCHDLARSKRRRPTTALDDLPYEPRTHDPLPHDATHDVWEAVEALPDSMRPLVHLFYYEGYTTDEIARLLNLNPSTVRTRLQRARAQMKATLGGAPHEGYRSVPCHDEAGRTPCPPTDECA